MDGYVCYHACKSIRVTFFPELDRGEGSSTSFRGITDPMIFKNDLKVVLRLLPSKMKEFKVRRLENNL
jgi:hypothetical protein